MEIVNWLDAHSIDYKLLSENVFSVDENYFLVLSKKEKIINEDFNVVVDEEELEILNEFQIPYVAFYFGDCWYYTSVDGETQFNLLRYVGQIKDPIDIPFLGVHGKFELLNGSRDYEDWCKKAKFLGIASLGIIEKRTLAGTMLFQEACVKHGIKPILGQTATINNKEGSYDVKIFCKNKQGWRNLLKINKLQLVDHFDNQHIPEEEFVKYGKGIVCILTPSIKYKSWMVKKLVDNFDKCYFQIDTTEYIGESHQREVLENTQYFLDNFKDIIDIIALNDAYYLEQLDNGTKKALNTIGKQNHALSQDQYFKTIDQLGKQYYELGLEPLFLDAVQSCMDLVNQCDFLIPTKNRYLPKYKMTKEENETFEDNEHLFHFLVLQGFEDKIYTKYKDNLETLEIYIGRLEEESEILIEGNVADYFLILSDVCKWCKKNGILVGHGRGSAGGALVSYLLDIIEIDPIEYDLLFSRFLTRGRLKGSLPDIDIDFSNRDAVIAYLKDRYGENYVASVATYGNMKVKNAIKDFSRINGISAGDANYITGFIGKEHEASDFKNVVKFALSDKKFKYFMVKNPKVFQYFNILLHQTRTASIHACATIIVPTEDEEGVPCDILDFIPTKIMDGQLVTEWEGAQLEKAGFLKEDILGLKQLEKFDELIRLVKNNHNVDINIYEIDLEQKEVFDLFSEGLTEDVFQFGSSGLKDYCKYLKPNSIEELTAANALYRPGAMESDAHIDFVKIKRGEKKPVYDLLLEEVTSKTFGLYIYQEQIMKAYSVITGADMEEADSFRKYITKAYKLKSKGLTDTEYEKYEKGFVEKYIEKGQNKQLAQQVWDKLVAFASYGFNRSHAAAYAIISYLSQWFKCNYPIEFWTTSLNESEDDNVPNRISEIQKHGGIKIYPVDINESGYKFTGSVENNSIYWSMSRVKFLGEKGVEVIINERNKNGSFFDVKEFYGRVKGRSVNKRSIENLILSGAFDSCYNVKKAYERVFILDQLFFEMNLKNEIDKYLPNKNSELFWQLKQYELTGYGGISYEKICADNGFRNYCNDLQGATVNSYVTISGLVTEIKIKSSAKVGDFAIIKLNCNNIISTILMWNECFEEFRNEVINSEDKILIVNGQVKPDKVSGQNSLQTNSRTKLVIL